MSSDYTSFECGFTPEFLHIVEFGLYRFMLSNCPEQLRRLREFEKMCVGENRVRMKDVSCRMVARRQSGEMTTSLGNGWSNLMMTAFLLRNEIDVRELRCVVEGDDGLFAIPEEYMDRVHPRNYEDFGFLLKAEWHDQVNEASFCKMVYDIEDGINLTNPIDQILSFGWSMGESIHARDSRLRDLLVAKTYSLAYEYSGCPILFKMTRWLLSFQLHVDAFEKINAKRLSNYVFPVHILKSKSFNSWQRDKFFAASTARLAELVSREPSMNSRLLMERAYGVTVVDQGVIEKWFDSHVGIRCPIDIPCLNTYMSPMAVDNLNRVISFNAGVRWNTINDYIRS
jgi:hypothetical protein